MQLLTIIQIIIGAIGFPVLIEVKECLSKKKMKLTNPFRLSLFTKITTITYGILLIIGTILILLLEFQHYFKDVSWHKSFFYAFSKQRQPEAPDLLQWILQNFQCLRSWLWVF